MDMHGKEMSHIYILQLHTWLIHFFFLNVSIIKSLQTTKAIRTYYMICSWSQVTQLLFRIPYLKYEFVASLHWM